jgi:hypothetical protein
MPNWAEFVRQRLCGVDAEEGEEIREEIAAHLEEAYESFRVQGLPEHEAVERTLVQAGDWKDLERRILLARREEPMKQRTQQLWIPGFLTFLLSTACLMTLQRLGFHPRLIGNGANAILFYGPWLAALPFFGALGAYLSARRGGALWTVLLTSVFPVLALTTAFLLMFPIDFAVKSIIGMPVDYGIVAAELLREGMGWILVPGIALLMGGLLAQLLLSRRVIPKEAVMS